MRFSGVQSLQLSLTKNPFLKIYLEGSWGTSDDKNQKFYSGAGSHDPLVVEPYVQAMKTFLSTFPEKPDVVDLGCGDFNVGSQLRALCNNYIACDIVEPMIEFNKEKFASLAVDFKVFDITKNRPPKADVIFVRQVLQHLSNDQIGAFLQNISGKFTYLVVTEHLPASDHFVHNLEQGAVADIRLPLNSGVVLTSEPFNLKFKENTPLCEVYGYGGVIRTNAYLV